MRIHTRKVWPRLATVLPAAAWASSQIVTAQDTPSSTTIDDIPVPPEGEKGWHCSETVCCRTTPWRLDDWFMENLPDGDSCQLELQFWGYFTVAAVVFLLVSLFCLFVYLTRFWTCWDPCRPCCLPCCAPPVEQEYLELGTTPLFGKIDSPLGGGGMTAPSTGWRRIVPDKDVYHVYDDINPLVPDYTSHNHNPNAAIYDYSTWVASLAPDTANAIRHHKGLIRHDQEQEHIGHVRHIANVLGHRMLPGFTGRVVPYTSPHPPFLRTPPHPRLPLSHDPPSDGDGSPVDKKQEGAVAVPIPPTESPATGDAPPQGKPGRSWWNPFAKKQPPPPPPPPPPQIGGQQQEGQDEEEGGEKGAGDDGGPGLLSAGQVQAPRRRGLPGFNRRGKTGYANEQAGESPGQGSPRRWPLAGLFKSPPKKAVESPEAEGAREQAAGEGDDLGGPDEETGEEGVEGGEGGGDEAEDGPEEEGGDASAAGAAGAASAPEKGEKKGRFGLLGRKKSEPAESQDKEESGESGDKGKGGLFGKFGKKGTAEGGAAGDSSSPEKRRLNFSPPWKRGKKGGDGQEAPPPPDLSDYEGREEELEKGKAPASPEGSEPRSSSKGASPARSASDKSESGSEGGDGGAGQTERSEEDRAPPAEIEEAEERGGDGDGPAAKPALGPPNTGLKPLAPLGGAPGGLAPLGGAPSGLAPLKSGGGGLAPLKPVGGKGAEEVRDSIQSLDSEDAF